MKLSLAWFQLFPFICKLIWKVSSFLLLLSLTCVTAIGLFKIDRVTIGARPHNFHLEISFNFKVFVQLLKTIYQNHEIYLVVKQYNWLCHKIGLRPQTFHLEPSFISKQFCNTSWISIQAKLHHYATINSWFHQNMRREYPFMCKAGRPRCKINSIIKYSFLDAKVSQACVAARFMGGAEAQKPG